MDKVKTLLRELKQTEPCLDGYLLGLKHGISLAQPGELYAVQLAQIEEMRRALEECDGQES